MTASISKQVNGSVTAMIPSPIVQIVNKGDLKEQKHYAPP
jgi:hypothetical protein